MSEVQGLRARIQAPIGRLQLDVELSTGAGTLVIVGPNGAGKSSLLSLILGALAVERGRIAVDNAVLLDTDAGVHVPLEYRGLGYVPQDYALFPHWNVLRNVAFALSAKSSLLSRDPSEPSRAGKDPRLAALLSDLGLTALLTRRVQTLSGGEKQRVALARALALQPCALLLDEPLAALDIHARSEVRGFLAGYLEKLALPTLLVTHDPEDARRLGRRVLVLEAGKVTQSGSWQELVARPATRFVEQFVAPAKADALPAT